MSDNVSDFNFHKTVIFNAEKKRKSNVDLTDPSIRDGFNVLNFNNCKNKINAQRILDNKI